MGRSSDSLLTVRLLGPLEVLVDGVPARLGGQRPRALISMLALSAGTPVSTSRLVDAIWDGRAPAAAGNTVQVYVSRLRRSLAPGKPTAGTPAAGIPATGTPAPGKPAAGTPATGTPTAGTPAAGTPATGKPTAGTPATGTPAPAGVTSPLRSTPAGYLLDIPEDAVDVNRFERLVVEGQARLRAGDAAGASRTLQSALALWRGPAVPELAGLRAAEGLVARLDARRLAARVSRIDAEAALERHAAIVPELEELVRLHPLDEGLVVRLMAALYRTGRQADALAAHAVAVARLDDELGVEPGPQLRQMHTDVLRHRVVAARPAARGRSAAIVPTASDAIPNAAASTPSTAPTTPSATPDTTPTTPDTTPTTTEPTPTTSGPGIPPTTTPTRPGIPPTTTDPANGTPAWLPGEDGLRPRQLLVGRAEEVARTLRLLANPQVRLVTVLGPGGTGKTRLAVEIAARLATAEGPGPSVVVVPLSGLNDPAELLAEVCRSLQAAPGWPEEPLLDVVVRALGDDPTVLVLDNLEQLVDGPGALDAVTALLDRLPALTVLCTSRTVLRLRGEYLLPLDPLPLPDPSTDLDLDSVRRSDAVRLFCERANAVLPGFDLTSANAPAVAEICRMLDGLPLALELAAARIRLLPPEQMVDRMAHRLELLSGGARDLPERQRSIRAALDWSAQMLDPAEARLFAQLSVFATGWTVEAAEAICDLDDEDVLAVLARLVDKSLVVAPGTGRLSMLETIREYAAESLAHDPEAGAVHTRHAAYYAALAEEVGPRTRTSPDDATRGQLDDEAANFATALEHANTIGDGVLLTRLVLGLLDYWFFSGRLGQADRWVRAAQTTRMPRAVEARLLLSVGSFAFIQADLTRAVAAFAGALQAARELNDHLLLARSLAASSAAARFSGQLTTALELLDEALTVARAGGPLAMLPQLENERGELLDGLGRPEEAGRLFQAYRDQALAEGDHSNLAWANVNLAMQASERGEHGVARRLGDAAIQAADVGGSTPIRADVRAAAGLIELRLGDARAALIRLREALDLTYAAGQLLTIADMVSLTGAALLRLGDGGAAARLLAAGRAWRQVRGLAVVGRLAQQAITEAEADVATVVPAQELARERQRGSSVPYAGLPALGLPETVPADAVDLRNADTVPADTVDLRSAEPKPTRAAEPLNP